MPHKLENITASITVGGHTGRYTGSAIRTAATPGHSSKYVPHGKGVMKYNRGWTYDGGWDNGHYSGQGTLITKNKKRVGTWSRGFMTGKGRLTTKDGTEYDGWFEAGKKSGFGTQKCGTGGSYSGQWKNDEPYGQGTWTWANGEWMQGVWYNNKTIGAGKARRVLHNGAIYKGETKDGHMTGTGTLTYKNGAVYRGPCKSGKANGAGSITKKGIRWEGTWHDDELKGEAKVTNLASGIVQKYKY